MQAPFSPAEGLLTVSRSGILYTQRFQISRRHGHPRNPDRRKHIPNLNIQVDVVGVGAAHG